ncbi:porphobilinogen synthase [Rarobacter incanus]|uniref:Delta-aminolevulinic acid dehydratase n=1 Tax=Rarobacter incanus TaxID=153494 RepID=A0A542SQG0_9MICO|nr:porphobilinogen synthase [Rarobacter incanus]TQK76851.1 porphobilinogen synthase [Rarobacter incanus]
MPIVRPQRARTSSAMRELLADVRIHPRDLVLPVFVKQGLTEPVPIPSMPGVVQHSIASLREEVRAAAAAGIGGVMIFGVPSVRNRLGSGATDPSGILPVAIRAARQEAGEDLVIFSDVCLDEFTDHGHCGILGKNGHIDGEATLATYATMAVLHAGAGADAVGLSGMMDGQTAHVRHALDEAGFTATSILSYTAKYASSFYGPFRDAVESTLVGNRRAYQMDFARQREALRALTLEAAAGADMVMVKPAGSYLDVVAKFAQASDLPVAAYQVSGEYSMIAAAGANGWIDADSVAGESLLSIKRAGASIILTYFALQAAGWIAAGTL